MNDVQPSAGITDPAIAEALDASVRALQEGIDGHCCLVHSILQKQTPAGQPHSPAARTTRLRLWEVDPSFRCPVIGMYLRDEERKRLIKKLGAAGKVADAFDVHERLVASTERMNRVSRGIDHLLGRRYAKPVLAMSEMDPAAILNAFDAAFDSGEIAGAVWAAAVRPGLTADVKRTIFGRIHMHMHQCAEQHANRMRKLARAQQENEDRVRRLKAVAAELRQARREIARLTADRAVMQAKLTSVEQENQRLAEACGWHAAHRKQALPGRESRSLVETSSAMGDCLHEARSQLEQVNARNRRLVEAIARQRQWNRRLKSELRDGLAPSVPAMRCDDRCPAFDLCNKRVLIGGGEPSQADHRRNTMSRNFQIDYRKNDGILHLNPQGDFDGSSTWELVNVLVDQYRGEKQVLIDTRSLRRILPFGCSMFNYQLGRLRFPVERICFKGDRVEEMASMDSDDLVRPDRLRCGCSGRCADCPCEKEGRAVLKRGG